MAKRGIDISAHQGDINLAALKNEIDFVIIRVGYGTKGTLDKKFIRNADLCKSLGIPFGFYWYSYALNEAGALAEAEACLNAIEPYKNDYTMGVWFDMEDADNYKRNNGMPSNQMLRNICFKFCEKVENAGYYVGIYASSSWFNNQLNGLELQRFDKWVAQWPTSNGKQTALNTNSDSRQGLNMWQFTSDAQFNNYNGRLDANYAYKDNFTQGQAQPIKTKTLDEIAQEVLDGAWGNGNARKNALIAAGYDYTAVQAKVNELVNPKPILKPIEEIAREVINNQWGNGADRKARLEAAGYNYTEVQNKVNELVKVESKKKTVIYTVKAGDTLIKIANKYNTTVNAIASKNNIKDVNKIKIGQKLKI